jgi:spore coat protein U-like protein
VQRSGRAAAVAARALVAVVLVLATPAAARAATCSISTTSVVFGSYSVFSTTPVDSTGTVTYRCSGSASVSITITRGQSSTFNPRTLAKGTEKLSYGLFLDAARTIIWGDASGGTQTYFNGSAPNNRDVTVTIHGRIPSGQDVASGAYTDTVTVVVQF